MSPQILRVFSWSLNGLLALSLFAVGLTWRGQVVSQHDRSKLIGSNITPSLRGLKGHDDRKFVILVLKAGCPYCSRSAKFYVKLASEASRKSVFDIVAVFPDEKVAAQSYARRIGLAVPLLSGLHLSDLRVTETPTILITNAEGQVMHSWTGFLSSDSEQAALQECLK